MSRAETLTEWIDPSIRDELDPDNRELALDIYDAKCPNKPPFGKDFIAAFRAAQIARNRKITDWALDTLDFLKKKNDGEMERAFVVHRTMCDVRWIDASIDPNGRKPNWCYLGDPRIANSAPAGLARYSSLRSWLSQWSYDKSNAKGPDERRAGEENAGLADREPGRRCGAGHHTIRRSVPRSPRTTKSTSRSWAPRITIQTSRNSSPSVSPR